MEASYTLAVYKWAMLNNGSHVPGSVMDGKLKQGSYARQRGGENRVALKRIIDRGDNPEGVPEES